MMINLPRDSDMHRVPFTRFLNKKINIQTITMEKLFETLQNSSQQKKNMYEYEELMMLLNCFIFPFSCLFLMCYFIRIEQKQAAKYNKKRVVMNSKDSVY